MKLGKIIHLGIVVEDLEKAVKIYEESLGIGPWEIQDAREFFAQMKVNGGYGLEIRTAMFHGEGYEIELITPTGGGVYVDWLRERGPGLHHVKFETEDNYQTIVSEAEQISGRPPYLNVEWPDGRPLVAYADLLDEAGLLIEVSGGE